MRATLLIPGPIHRDLKRHVARRGASMSELATEMIRKELDNCSKATQLPPLPCFNAGRMLVDVADRDALYDVLNAG